MSKHAATKTETAAAAYASNKQRIEFALSHLQARLKGYASCFKTGGQTNWAYVGDLGHVAGLIEQAAEFIGQ